MGLNGCRYYKSEKPSQITMSAGRGLYPIRVLGGALFVLAGFAAYFGVKVSTSLPILPVALVAVGAALILTVLTHLRVVALDIAVLLVGIIVLSAAVSGYSFASRPSVTYSATRGEVTASHMNLVVTSSAGSINIEYASNSDLAYNITIGGVYSFFPFVTNTTVSFSNQTLGDTIFLKAFAAASSINVELGRGYFTDINATSALGSVKLSLPSSVNIGTLRLSAGAGSIDASVSGQITNGLYLNTGTGSISLQSDNLSAAARDVPLDVSAGLGSINLNVAIPHQVATSLSASAGLGSITNGLQDFTISQVSSNKLVASAGEVGTSNQSFLVTISTGTGSENLAVSWSR